MNSAVAIEFRFLHVTAVAFLIVLLSACATPSKVDISLLPMYGDVQKTEKQKQADEIYLKTMDANFSSRRAASQSAAKAGWGFLRKRDLNTAMRRFNQSWLLDPNYYEAYAGFAQILDIQGNFQGASKMAEKAMNLGPADYRLMCDAASAHGKYALSIENNSEEKAKYLKKSASVCEHAALIHPDGSCIYFNWAITLFHMGEYLEAWQKVKKLEDLGYGHRKYFIDDLSRKMPRPKSL